MLIQSKFSYYLLFYLLFFIKQISLKGILIIYPLE